MIIGLLQALCVVLFINSAAVQANTDASQPARPASSIAITPGKIDFGSQAVGVTSQPRSAILNNVSPAEVTITDISASGIDFKQSNDCPPHLAPGAKCTIEVTFAPAITGPRLGTIIVSGSDPASPRFLVLSGTGE